MTGQPDQELRHAFEERVKQLPASFSPAGLLLNFGELRKQYRAVRAWPRPYWIYVLSKQGPHGHSRKPEDDFSDAEIAAFETEARRAQSLVAADAAIGARLDALRQIGVRIEEQIEAGRSGMGYRFKLLADDPQIEALEALAAEEAGYRSKGARILARLRYRMWLAQNYNEDYRFWRAALPVQGGNPYRREAGAA